MKHINILLLIASLFIMQACGVHKVFNAPVIYSLDENIAAANTGIYSADTIAAVKNQITRDTVHYIKDSIRYVNDTVHYIIKEKVPYYPAQTKAAQVIQPGDSVIIKDTTIIRKTTPALDSATRRAYLKRVDSLERRINELLRMDSINKNTGVQNIETNSSRNDLMPDKVSNDETDSTLVILNRAKSRLIQSEGKVKEMQKVQQAYRDSALYYKQLAFAQSLDADNLKQERKWYQLRAKKNGADNSIPETIQRQKFYDDKISALEQNINDIKNQNALLNESYSRLRADQNNNNRQRANPSPVIVATENHQQRLRDNNHTAELLLLQGELNALRNQPRDRPVSSVTHSDTVYMMPAAPIGLASRPDSSQLDSLRSELASVRTQIQQLQDRQLSQPAQTVAEITPAAKPAFSDARRFPIVSIYFMTGSFKASRDQAPKLTPFARIANEDTTATIVLNGFTDGVGKIATNKILAAKRTRHVKDLLVTNYKISSTRITMEEPIITERSSGKSDPLSRRVDLQFK